MSAVYRTKDGDVLDQIALSHYGQVPGATEHVLAANPALRHVPAVLPAGLVVLLPAFTPKTTDTRVRLWS